MSSSKYRFLDIFQENQDGTLSPKIKINVNGIILFPGTLINDGSVFGGINFHQYKYLDIAGEYSSDDIFIITGFFK